MCVLEKWTRVTRGVFYADEARRAEAIARLHTPLSQKYDPESAIKVAENYRHYTAEQKMESRLWKSTFVAMRNEIIMRIFCEAGACEVAALEEHIEEICCKVDMVNLRSQLFLACSRMFPNQQKTKKRNRKKQNKEVDDVSFKVGEEDSRVSFIVVDAIAFLRVS